MVLLTEEILHQLRNSLSHYFQGFVHLKCLFGISCINSIKQYKFGLWRRWKFFRDHVVAVIGENIRCRHSGRGPWSSKRNLKRCSTWRIIPVSKWLITMVSFHPLSRDSFPFQMGVSWLTNGGDPNQLLTRDDPPSSQVSGHVTTYSWLRPVAFWRNRTGTERREIAMKCVRKKFRSLSVKMWATITSTSLWLNWKILVSQIGTWNPKVWGENTNYLVNSSIPSHYTDCLKVLRWTVY